METLTLTKTTPPPTLRLGIQLRDKQLFNLGSGPDFVSLPGHPVMRPVARGQSESHIQQPLSAAPLGRQALSWAGDSGNCKLILPPLSGSSFANPLERCLALGAAAQRAAPVSGGLNRSPEGLIPASETQPPIPRYPRDEPGKCCTDEFFSSSKPMPSSHMRHQELNPTPSLMEEREGGSRLD
ncbi:unnamed protein product [Pleuronectes platessa]|uniref:Uncharacterized protein n=1 Tax=Pleuronectes platessa TaxID=8262 RepID=A0A9N7YIV1_PLEPL|nr:unnamed protein product [Pleuronectes platessa]